MNGNAIVRRSGDGLLVDRGWHDGKRIEVLVKVGGTYRVVPTSSLKLRHRDRICTILEFILDEKSGEPWKFRVRFHDNNRQGVVDALTDFAPPDSA